MVVVDCENPEQLATFWHELTGATVAAEALGARRTGVVVEEDDDPSKRFQVMLDPEGNEFCLLAGYD